MELADPEETMVSPKRSTGPKYLSAEQVRALFKVADKRPLRDRVLVRMLYAFGMRISEALAVRMDDLDLERRELTIQGMKNGLTRTYTIPRELMPLLKRMQPKGAFLFDSRESKQWTRIPAYLSVKAMMKEAGLGKFSPHALRHARGVGILEAGLPMEAVKDYLRHKSIRSSEIYATVTPALRSKWDRELEKSSRIVKG